MTRPTLTLAGRSPPPKAPSLSMVKKAIRLFRGKGVPKATYRRNALAWIRAHTELGDKHCLKGGAVQWGRPGEPSVAQIHAPRRLGQRS